ncbi:pentapeptide repeat-containing protein [Dolichospermum planctonicum CS-1226]|uniref:Pentapeptide repeat-containing protein n=1 Tax=Dolichospermum planctonicum CS-1226 TaxID=3021751 RepID=A0ABT5AKQ9_9CYAN|nr:pentapeptide repeat-containing protein [Dolichospermum planctonicum]MDB9537897.1 pentapeptide repeat-containing protein [Dolichospermum planctonicum CS-1226]
MDTKKLLKSYKSGERIFPDINLHQAKLSHVNLRGINLPGAKLSHY